ncbi:MAG: putative virulence factor [Deltaproteobacteria bacterium]|jgi:hypothetical protein|nr:putative virulence factor [Deltaproteobacteria bacterium]
MNLEELKEISLTVRKSAREGEKWLLDNESSAGPQEVVRKRLRRSARFLKTYADAAGSKAGVAVFGPSQAGKSTLISALAKGPTGSLRVDFGAEVLDYMLSINPEGGNETTGLVTRFSLDHPAESPDPAKPVCLKLFSEADIIKILANTYFGEAKGAVRVQPDDIKKILDDLSKKPPAKSTLTLDDMEDLAEYVRGISEVYASGPVLEAHFWPRAAELAVRLSLTDRVSLFSCLWGNLDQFNSLYVKLFKALEQLGHQETAFSGLNALYQPELAADSRKNSVLHVDRLMGLLDDGGDTVEVVSLKGQRASLTRPVLSALIAEIHVKVVEKPGRFMDYADILDFPGYRAREKLSDITEEMKNPEVLKKCFLRGKVAYLFERYCARHEITAMLLCIGDSVQNNPDLPAVIDHWLKDTHGELPEDRYGKPVCLFLVLTKFDRMLEKGTGSSDPVTRWDNRYNASFLQFFSNHSWPKEWTKKGSDVRPFNNIYWLLNLGFADGFFNIEKSPGESGEIKCSGVRDDQAGWVENIRQGYLDSETTKKHVREPEAAWEAIAAGSDGGVSYIVQNLTPILETDLKLSQLVHLTAAEAQSVERTLKEFYQGGDKEEEKKIKEAWFKKMAVCLTELQTKRVRLGLFLRSVILSDDDCHTVFSRSFSGRELESMDYEGKSPEAAQESRPVLDDLESFLFGSEPAAGAEPAGPVPAPSPARITGDSAYRYRRRVENAWQARLDDVQNDPKLLRYYGFPRDVLQQLLAELVQGAKRLSVMDTIESQLREALSYSNVNPERLLWKQSRLASAYLSDYVSFLGLSPYHLSEQERTVRVLGREALLFALPKVPAEVPELPEIQASYDLLYFQDWLRALYRLMIQNVEFAEKNYDIEENARLGRIIGADLKALAVLGQG